MNAVLCQMRQMKDGSVKRDSYQKEEISYGVNSPQSSEPNFITDDEY